MTEICLYDLEGAEYEQVSSILKYDGCSGCTCPRCERQGLRVFAKRSRAYHHPLLVPSLNMLNHRHTFVRDGDIHRCSYPGCSLIKEYEQE